MTLRVLFLGTAAAEGIPAPFCECGICTHARQVGGHDVRMRTATLINNDLLIDFGPDIVASAQRLGISLSGVETLLVTHNHMDHWYPENLILRAHWFRATPVPPLRVFGPETVVGDLLTDARWSQRAEEAMVSAEAVKPGDRWRGGRYQFMALPAAHAGGEGALLYIISDGDRKLFYSTDTGPLSEQAWRMVAQEAPFDAVLMDETLGTWETLGEHQGFDVFLQARQRFADEGWMKDGALFVAFHFSHHANPVHEELVQYFKPHGVTVAYDGLSLVL